VAQKKIVLMIAKVQLMMDQIVINQRIVQMRISRLVIVKKKYYQNQVRLLNSIYAVI